MRGSDAAAGRHLHPVYAREQTAHDVSSLRSTHGDPEVEGMLEDELWDHIGNRGAVAADEAWAQEASGGRGLGKQAAAGVRQASGSVRPFHTHAQLQAPPLPVLGSVAGPQDVPPEHRLADRADDSASPFEDVPESHTLNYGAGPHPEAYALGEEVPPPGVVSLEGDAAVASGVADVGPGCETMLEHGQQVYGRREGVTTGASGKSGRHAPPAVAAAAHHATSSGHAAETLYAAGPKSARSLGGAVHTRTGSGAPGGRKRVGPHPATGAVGGVLSSRKRGISLSAWPWQAPEDNPRFEERTAAGTAADAASSAAGVKTAGRLPQGEPATRFGVADPFVGHGGREVSRLDENAEAVRSTADEGHDDIGVLADDAHAGSNGRTAEKHGSDEFDGRCVDASAVGSASAGGLGSGPEEPGPGLHSNSGSDVNIRSSLKY